MNLPGKNFPYYGAFESTKIHGWGTDILETTRHLQRSCEDIDLLLAAGVKHFRYPAPWHRIESSPGLFDFTWMDQPMQHMRRRNIRPVIDLLHHTSFPDWLEDGFLNPEFPRLFSRYVERFARRYPWVDTYTIFNEPLATTLLCSYTGVWYPYHKSDESFVRMGWNVAKAMLSGEQVLRSLRPNFSLVYIDTCEHHAPLDTKSVERADFCNRRRFWILDLLLGKITADHPLRSYLARHGLKDREFSIFADSRAKIDVLGLDSYPHSEMEWSSGEKHGHATVTTPPANPIGFARIARQYAERYGLPIMLAETNVRGTVSDRLTWLRYMQEQCESLVDAGLDFRGFCWYPSIDSTDWSNLCANCTKSVDPQGIWYLDDKRWTRHPSELSEWYSRLARGTARAADLPAYRLLPPLDRTLAGYLKLMDHWEQWLEPENAEECAA